MVSDKLVEKTLKNHTSLSTDGGHTISLMSILGWSELVQDTLPRKSSWNFPSLGVVGFLQLAIINQPLSPSEKHKHVPSR